MKSIGGWSLRLALLCCFLAVGFTVHPQSANSSYEPMTISQRLTSLKENATKLSKLLEVQVITLNEARTKLSELQSDLTAAQNALANSLESLNLSQQDIARLTISLEHSSQTLLDLRQTFDHYQETARRQIRRGWIVGGIGLAIGVLIAAIF